MWSWSHTQEAYHNAYNNTHKIDRKQLEEIYIEWKVFEKYGEDAEYEHFEEIKDQNNLDNLTNDILADYIWDKASETQRCDNGGFNCHICPYQCHKVSFDKVK